MKRGFCLTLACLTLLLNAGCGRAAVLLSPPPETAAPSSEAPEREEALSALEAAASGPAAQAGPAGLPGLAALLRAAAEQQPCAAGSSLRLASLAGGLLAWMGRNPGLPGPEELAVAVSLSALRGEERRAAARSFRLLEDAALRLTPEEAEALLRDAGFEAGISRREREDFRRLTAGIRAALEKEIFKNGGKSVNISGNTHCRTEKSVLR